jgi:hypothetical protein
MTSGPADSISEALQTLLETLDADSGAGLEGAYGELTEHTVSEEFASAENVAEDFYEDYRMLGRFEVFSALLEGDADRFRRLLTETADFVAEDERDR